MVASQIPGPTFSSIFEDPFQPKPYTLGQFEQTGERGKDGRTRSVIEGVMLMGLWWSLLLNIVIRMHLAFTPTDVESQQFFWFTFGYQAGRLVFCCDSSSPCVINVWQESLKAGSDAWVHLQSGSIWNQEGEASLWRRNPAAMRPKECTHNCEQSARPDLQQEHWGTASRSGQRSTQPSHSFSVRCLDQLKAVSSICASNDLLINGRYRTRLVSLLLLSEDPAQDHPCLDSAGLRRPPPQPWPPCRCSHYHLRSWSWFSHTIVIVGGYLYDMTVFVGPEMVNFPAPPKPDPKISQRALSPDMFPNKGLNASLLQPIPPSC